MQKPQSLGAFPGAIISYKTVDREGAGVCRTVGDGVLVLDDCGSDITVKLADVLGVQPPALDKPQSIHVVTDSAAHDPVRQQAAVDAMLIGAGFIPDIDYIRARYGGHWQLRQDTTATDIRAAVAEFATGYATQLQGLAAAVSALAEKSAHTPEIQAALVAALGEARKPVDINIKLEMPERAPKAFVAERDSRGGMTIRELESQTVSTH